MRRERGVTQSTHMKDRAGVTHFMSMCSYSYMCKHKEVECDPGRDLSPDLHHHHRQSPDVLQRALTKLIFHCLGPSVSSRQEYVDGEKKMVSRALEGWMFLTVAALRQTETVSCVSGQTWDDKPSLVRWQTAPGLVLIDRAIRGNRCLSPVYSVELIFMRSKDGKASASQSLSAVGRMVFYFKKRFTIIRREGTSLSTS